MAHCSKLSVFCSLFDGWIYWEEHSCHFWIQETLITICVQCLNWDRAASFAGGCWKIMFILKSCFYLYWLELDKCRTSWLRNNCSFLALVLKKKPLGQEWFEADITFLLFMVAWTSMWNTRLLFNLGDTAHARTHTRMHSAHTHTHSLNKLSQFLSHKLKCSATNDHRCLQIAAWQWSVSVLQVNQTKLVSLHGCWDEHAQLRGTQLRGI